MKEALGTHDTADDSEASVGKRAGLASTGGQSAGSAPESKQKESASTPPSKKPAFATNKTRKVTLKTTSASAAIRKSRFRKKVPPVQGRDDTTSETSSPE